MNKCPYELFIKNSGRCEIHEIYFKGVHLYYNYHGNDYAYNHEQTRRVTKKSPEIRKYNDNNNNNNNNKNNDNNGDNGVF